jgi:hypothetical protein
MENSLKFFNLGMLFKKALFNTRSPYKHNRDNK